MCPNLVHIFSLLRLLIKELLFIGEQRGRRAARHGDIHILADLVIAFREDDDFVLAVAAVKLVSGAFGGTFDEHAESFAHVALVAGQGEFALEGDNLFETARFLLVGDIVFKAFG